MSLIILNKDFAAIKENAFLSGWAKILSRHPDQLNKMHESDAEILALPINDRKQKLAATMDTVSEEISHGFYKDPITMGWVSAMASLSDLAAVGATPLGILVSATLPELPTISELQQGIAKGIEAACQLCNTYVLGGDTNHADKISLTVCALGLISSSKTLSRIGANTGDIVYSTGTFGDGAVLAAKSILHIPNSIYDEANYRPTARIKEGKIIADFATSCMDTSDGFIATIDQLCRINKVGIEVTAPMDSLLSHASQLFSTEMHVPAFSFLASLHGEFELIFTVSESDRGQFESYANHNEFFPKMIGRVTEKQGIYFGKKEVDGMKIRNLYADVDGDLNRYMTDLLAISKLF